MGGAPYFRFKQGDGPTFMTSILQLYAKVRPGLHTLYSRFRLRLNVRECVR